MRTFLALYLVCTALAVCPPLANANDERLEEELSCRPENGSVTLPGILYDDLSSLARQTFGNDPVAVSQALYSLPDEQREEFISMYLNREARERHRYFFARCRDRTERRNSFSPFLDPVIPTRIRTELHDRERARLAVREDSLSYRIGNTSVIIPLPFGYGGYDARAEDAVFDLTDRESLAVFGKFPQPLGEPTAPGRHQITAMVRHIGESSELLPTILAGYRVMVDDGWRLVGVSPPGAGRYVAETLTYRWNLEPFAVRENSFCYGGFEKRVDFRGGSAMRYRAVAVILLPEGRVELAVTGRTSLTVDMVEEMNADLVHWRDAVIAANRF